MDLTDTMIKALHVIAPAPAGGAEAVVIGLVRETRRRGGPVAVAALVQSASPREFIGAMRELGADVTEIRCGRRRYWAERRRLLEMIREVDPMIVHTHVYHADVVGYFAARKAGYPVVATLHGYTVGDWKHRLYQRLDLEVIRRMDGVIGVSEQLCDTAVSAGCDPKRVHLVSNGYADRGVFSRRAARDALGLEEDDVVVGWVGRLSREKGADLLLEAVRQRQPTSEVVTVLIGDGPERAACERVAGGNGAIRLVGARQDAAALMPAFDVLAITSRSEGLPMVLLEAMAAEVPIVAFAVGAIPTVVDDRSAWLVAPEDVGAFGRALSTALASRPESAARAVSAKRVLEVKFGAAAWLDRVQAVYTDVLGSCHL